MTAAFNQDLPSAISSLSRASTSSSSRTVRASVVNTPAARPPQTPSYPFPYIPGTSSSTPSGLQHQPFTVLSPTAAGPSDTATPRHDPYSVLHTSDTARGPVFVPPGNTPQTTEDLRYPTPNLYDLVLRLSSEPGLDDWWANTSNVLRDAFSAQRLSLTLPADTTDLENVPWGQKATYNFSGVDPLSDSHASSSTSSSHGSNAPLPHDIIRQPRPHVAFSRPTPKSRHSYAGHSPSHRETALLRRPALVSRTASQMPSSTPANPVKTIVAGENTITPRRSSTGAGDMTSSGTDVTTSEHGSQSQTCAAVFPVLRGLDREIDGLLETSGVNKVLSRGRIVTLTRDYTQSATARNVDARVDSEPSIGQQQRPSSGTAKPIYTPHGSALLSSNHSHRRGSQYEDYEQTPASPWAQSPAPSPAVQADPDINPFFASHDSVENTFEPTATTPDYTKATGVEAIGVDSASTVIHLPLIHPTLASDMHPLPSHMPFPNTNAGGYESIEHFTESRKAPLAIISILSHAVPYPSNLVQALDLLGPHLAVSFYMAQQFSAAQSQAHVRNDQRESDRVPLSVNAANLEELVHRDQDAYSANLSGSITSPSDYSGRSKHSPTSSIAGTPGWDVSMHDRSSSGIPSAHGHAEHGGSYFDLQRHRPVQSRAPSQVNPANPISSRRSDKTKSNVASENERDSRFRVTSTGKGDRTPLKIISTRPSSPSRGIESATGSPSRSTMRTPNESNAEATGNAHTLLHSYGADFASSFQSLPSSASKKHFPSAVSHLRNPSLPDVNEMPPPSERLLRTIIDSLPVQIFTVAPQSGALTWVNSKFLVYRGQDQRKVLDAPWDTIHPDDKDPYMEQWHKSLRTGAQLQHKLRLQRFDGQYRWFYVRAAPLRDKRQNIVHWIGTNMDFHEQHLAEQIAAKQHETAASEMKYRALANSSPQVVFTVTKDKGITFCNTQWTSFSDQTEAAALGLGFMEHVHPDDIVRCHIPTSEDQLVPAYSPPGPPVEPRRSFSSSQTSSMASSETTKPIASPLPGQEDKIVDSATSGSLKETRDADGKPSYSTEIRLRSKDGAYRWHLVRVVAEDEVKKGDDAQLWYGTCTDINDQKTLEKELKESMDEKSRFLSNMSHEIRTPLNGITGMVNFLIDSNLTTEQLEQVNIIRASTEGLRGLINDILDLSKAEAGMIQLNVDWLHVRSLIEEVNDLTWAMASDKGLELNYLIEANVPVQIRADRFRIRQILLNIIGNAIKFSQVGEVMVKCSVLRDDKLEPAPDAMYVQFEVIDTGRGFTEQEAGHLFKRFSQIDGSSTKQHGGTGLGLVISQQLAQLHGGDVAARSVPGKGSCFTFYIRTSLPEADQAVASSVADNEVDKLNQTLPNVSRTRTVAQSSAGSPRVLSELLRTTSRDSPASIVTVDSTSSGPSVQTVGSSLQSDGSSASSYVPHDPPMKLTMPPDTTTVSDSQSGSQGEDISHEPSGPAPLRTVSFGGSMSPRVYSVLVVCPLEHTRNATIHHLETTLPKSIPHQISAKSSMADCRAMVSGQEPVVFSHIVSVIPHVEEIVGLLQLLVTLPSCSMTRVVIITDVIQRRALLARATVDETIKHAMEHHVHFIYKPLKPSRFAAIFDPHKHQESSTDRNQHSAQQVAMSQKQNYAEMKKRLGDSEKRVLLVEDNRLNQMV